MKRIVLTGGGTAGHVTPNMALVPSLKEAGYDIQYIGSYNGIEKRLIEEMGIPYHGISSGKLRRYFDPKNFSDPFKVMKGYLEASHMIRKLKPDIVFDDSKPVLLVMGGSLGAVAINNAIRENLDELLKQFQIIHLCGRGHYDTSLDGKNGYKQFEYAKKELTHLFAATDLIISRAGANSSPSRNQTSLFHFQLPRAVEISF